MVLLAILGSAIYKLRKFEIHAGPLFELKIALSLDSNCRPHCGQSIECSTLLIITHYKQFSSQYNDGVIMYGHRASKRNDADGHCDTSLGKVPT